MANESMGLLGRKLGMTQLFAETGDVIPVTVIQLGPNTVLQVKTEDGPDGYNAVQLGFEPKKEQKTTKALKGHFDRADSAPMSHMGEVRLSKDAVASYQAGQVVRVGDVFSEGGHVDVMGVSKGRGFTGVMKRHHFRGFLRTHGTHEFFRHGGSIGTTLTPGRVLKGKKMAGQVGNERVTVQNLWIARVDTERDLIFVRGGVPGATGGLVTVRQAVKK